MDLGLIFILLSFMLSVFFLFYYLGSSLKPGKGETRLPKTPPGRLGLPFIGETLDFYFTRSKEDPEKFVFDRIKKYSSNVFKTSLLAEPFALLCGAEGNKFIFSNESKLVKSWWPYTVRKLFNFPDKIPAWESTMKNRKLFHPYLTPDTLQKYVHIMDLVTKQHLHSYWEGRGSVTVLPLSKLLTSTLAFRLFLGVEDVEFAERLHELFVQLMKGLICLPVNFPGTNFNQALKAKEKIRKELKAYIKKWNSELSDGKLSDSASRSILADILKQSTLDEDDIFNSLMALSAAAFETTSSTLACVIMVLAKYPSVYNIVLAEQREIAKSKAPGEVLNWSDVQKMKYSWNVICEVLRLYTSGIAFREVMADFTYEDFLIPKGWKLLIDTCQTHNNPKYFKNPKKFDPSRFEGDGPIPFTFIPFGGGPRMCPGREYAKTKILIFMHYVVTKFRWEQIVHNEKMMLDPMPVPSEGLPIRLYSHE